MMTKRINKIVSLFVRATKCEAVGRDVSQKTAEHEDRRFLISWTSLKERKGTCKAKDVLCE